MPQSKCPYYSEHVRSAGNPPQPVRCAYCEHKYSPVRRLEALAGTAPALKCGGNFSRCQIPLDRRLDT